jgi:hypothetical protein
MALPLLAGLAKGALVVGKGAAAGGKAGAMAAAKTGAKGAAKGAAKKAISGGGRKMATKITNRSSGSRGGALVKSSPSSKLVEKTDTADNPATPKGVEAILGVIERLTKNIKKTLAGMLSLKKRQVTFKENQERGARKAAKESGFKKVGSTLAFAKNTAEKIPFFQRIQKFFMNILIGTIVMWLVQNIDKVIETIMGVVKFFQDMWALLDEYLFQPLKIAFEWFSSEGIKIINEILEFPPIKWMIDPIKQELEKIVKLIPGLESLVGQIDGEVVNANKRHGGSYQGQGGGGARGFAGGGTATFELIAGGEGGYNSVNRGTAGDTPGGAKSLFGKELTEMTVGEIMDAQAAGNVFAVGKYQIVPTTMLEFIAHPEGGVSRTDKFDAATQEKFKDYVINIKRPEIGRYLRGETSDPTEAGQAIAREFASVGLQYGESGRSRGQSRYAGTGGNRASISPEEIMEALKADRAAGSVPQRVTPPSARQSGFSTGGQAYGTGLKTGPSAYIGGSAEYHIDTKLKSDMSMEDTVAYFDQMARAYEKEGRIIEFSNAAVAGARYKSTMSMQEKIGLLQRAAGAHASRAGYRSFDYYVPLESAADREHHSAEGAEIHVPTAPGGHIDYHSGGRYGNFVIIYDASGREVGRTGHGDTRYGRSSGRVQTPTQAPPPAQVSPPVERSSAAEDVSQRTSYERPNQVIVQTAMASPTPSVGGGGGGTVVGAGGGQSAESTSNTYLRAIMANNMYRIG